MPPKAPSDPDRLLRRLEWTILRPLDGLLVGDYRSLFQGAGLDFTGLRPYAYGDDVRTIDWNATARKEETQVRRYHEDRSLDAWFVVDTSPSLHFGVTGRPKSDLAFEMVGALAGMLTQHGNRVGGCVYDGGLPRLFPMASGRQAVLTLLRGLGAGEVGGFPGETDLRVPLEAMAGVLRRRSLVFVVSDFQCSSGWEQVLGALAVRHEVVAVRIHDAGESDLPDLGTLWLEDSETGQQITVDTGDPGFRRRMAVVAAERDASLTAAFQRSGIDALSVSTTDDLVLALLGFAHRRRHRKFHPGKFHRGGAS